MLEGRVQWAAETSEARCQWFLEPEDRRVSWDRVEL
jgi:hypothetical protein